MAARKGDEDMQIRLATADWRTGEYTLPAESLLVRTFSGVAKSLPPNTSEWDVSGLLLDGQPFSRQTVHCWVSCCCCVVHGPSELDPEDVTQLSTARSLHQVLSFAHAVGSPDGLLRAACSQLGVLKCVVQLPEQTLEMPMWGGQVIFVQPPPAAAAAAATSTDSLLQLTFSDWGTIGSPLVSVQQRNEVQREVAKQTAALLRIALMLRLTPLTDAMHTFVFSMAANPICLLYGVLDSVFTDAVYDVLLSSSTTSKQSYIRKVLTRPCPFARGCGDQNFLQPMGQTSINPTTLAVEFDAQLLRDFAGCHKGSMVHVELDLFHKTNSNLGFIMRALTTTGSCMSYAQPLQLILGTNVDEPAVLEEVMKCRMLP